MQMPQCPQVVGPVQVGLLKCKDRTRATTCHLAPIMIHFLAQSSVRPFFTILTSLSSLFVILLFALLCSARCRGIQEFSDTTAQPNPDQIKFIILLLLGSWNLIFTCLAVAEKGIQLRPGTAHCSSYF